MHANLLFAAVSPPWKASQMTEAERAPPNTPRHDWNACLERQIPKQSPSAHTDSSSIGNNAPLFLILSFFSKSVWKTQMFFPEGPLPASWSPEFTGALRCPGKRWAGVTRRGPQDTVSHAGSGEGAVSWTSTGVTREGSRREKQWAWSPARLSFHPDPSPCLSIRLMYAVSRRPSPCWVL